MCLEKSPVCLYRARNTNLKFEISNFCMKLLVASGEYLERSQVWPSRAEGGRAPLLSPTRKLSKSNAPRTAKLDVLDRRASRPSPSPREKAAQTTPTTCPSPHRLRPRPERRRISALHERIISRLCPSVDDLPPCTPRTPRQMPRAQSGRAAPQSCVASGQNSLASPTARCWPPPRECDMATRCTTLESRRAAALAACTCTAAFSQEPKLNQYSAIQYTYTCARPCRFLPLNLTHPLLELALLLLLPSSRRRELPLTLLRGLLRLQELAGGGDLDVG